MRAVPTAANKGTHLVEDVFDFLLLGAHQEGVQGYGHAVLGGIVNAIFQVLARFLHRSLFNTCFEKFYFELRESQTAIHGFA